eukprot:TRINITY_DN17186_c0_g1_i1.p1 TRINITY_DN17186_c0_g1~~TRINITY_DN17186_c0_g1_i1.p1  ORF type:complete len:377 (-),score=77.41 TRINITY_DN17186_c0_g1_i1:156-1229(-)
MAAALVVERGPGAEPDLRAMLATKQEEAASLRLQVEQMRLEAQQVRLQLQVSGVEDPSLVPNKIQAGNGAADAQHYELRSLFQWLVDSVDLSHQVVFECGSGEGEVHVGGRRVLLQRMATWQLSTGLKLSVPLELQAEIAGMLTEARQKGRLADSQLHRLASTWELVGAEVVAAPGTPEPAIFLVHRQTSQAVVVAQWPSVDFVRATAAVQPFDPQRHFGRLAETSSIAGVVSPPPSVAAGQQGPWQLPNSGSQSIVSMGDKVEVEFEGQWFAGTLQSVEGHLANVKCDVDPGDVITLAPLSSIRRQPPQGLDHRSQPQDEPPKAAAGRPRASTGGVGSHEPVSNKIFRHTRARSVG